MADQSGKVTGVPGETGWDRAWQHVIDFFLTIWVLRAPIVGLAIGAAILLLAPQAQDVLVDLATPGSLLGWLRIIGFYLLLTFVWAMPTHYAARLLLNTDDRYRRHVATRKSRFLFGLRKWMPRILGLLTFAAMLGAAWRAQHNLPLVVDTGYDRATISRHLMFVAAGIVISAVAFWLYTVYRESIAGRRMVRRAEAMATAPMAALRHVLPSLTRDRHGGESNLGPLLLFGFTIVFVALPFASPELFARIFPRALSVPFIIGGWLPLAAYLTGLGRRFRVPIVLLLLAGLAVLESRYGASYYSVRLLSPEQSAGTNRGEITLNKAVELWKRANGNCDGETCPRPIIVAASGGASRAGFFTAGLIGQLLDDDLRPTQAGHGLPQDHVTRRIFAISAVSGSSTGAVVTVAALGASNKGKQPCASSAGALWFGDEVRDWRGCLEILMSGDFLTPVFAGFTFGDLFPFASNQSRATLLERSWERRFSESLEPPRNDDHGLECARSLECPFMTLRPTTRADGSVRWLPLLVLNGTSVGNGQRIITTPLAMEYMVARGRCPIEPRAASCPLFADAKQFHDLAALTVRGSSQQPVKMMRDVRLSTAAHNSARFPLVSPPGLVPEGETSRAVDRILDGGIFENFGAQSATELALAIRAIDDRLRPFILVLSNDPEIPPKTSPVPRETNYASQGNWVTDISSPLKAFIHTRDARGALAVDEAIAVLDQVDRTVCNVAWIRVWGEPGEDGNPRPVPLSWWLSKPVQVFLHEQTDFRDGKPVSTLSRNTMAATYLLAALTGREPAAVSQPQEPGDPACRQIDADPR